MSGMTDVHFGGATSESKSSEQLEIRVVDAVTQGGGTLPTSAYTSYKLNIATNLPAFRNSRFSVIRRFSDFVWLRDQLQRDCPGYIIPPVPDKVLNKFSSDLVAARQRQLERFLRRVASHPALMASKSFVVFLEGTEDAFNSYREAKARQASAESSTIGKLFGSAAAAVSSAFATGSVSTKSAEDIAFGEVETYLAGLETQLANVQKHVTAVVQRRQEMADSFFQFGLAFTLLGKSERDVLAVALSSLGKTADGLSVFAKKHASNELYYFEEPLADYIRIVAAVKGALASRAEKMVVHQAARDELEQRRAAVQRLVGVAGKQDQLALAQGEVAKAQHSVQKAKAEMDEVSTRVLEEVERFKREKLADFKGVLLDYVQLQIDYNTRLEQAWNELIPALEEAQLRESRQDGDAGVGAGAGNSAAAPTPVSGSAPVPPTR